MKRKTSSNVRAAEQIHAKWTALDDKASNLEEGLDPIRDQLFILEHALKDHLTSTIFVLAEDGKIESGNTWDEHAESLTRAQGIVAWARELAGKAQDIEREQAGITQEQNELAVPTVIMGRREAFRRERDARLAKWARRNAKAARS